MECTNEITQHWVLTSFLQHCAGEGTSYVEFQTGLSFFSFCLLIGLHPRHMGVPRLGVKSGLQLPAYARATATRDPSHAFDLHHSSRQRRILNPLSEARDQTCILTEPGQVLFH